MANVNNARVQMLLSPVTLIAVLLFFGIADEAESQQVEQFDAVQGLVVSDDPVIVEISDSTVVRGRVVRVSATELEIRTETASRSFVSAEIAAVIRPRDSLGNGAIIGMAVFGGAAVASEALCGPVCTDKGATIVGVAVAGAGIGTIIDYLIGREKVLYRNTASSGISFRVVPLVAKVRRGIHLTIRF